MNTSDLFTPGRKKARVEIIPLIDVIFFLLATFVLFTLSLNHINALKIPMPNTMPSPEDPTMVFIQTSAGDTVYWKQGTSGAVELMSLTELPARFQEYKRRVPSPRVMVRGDNQAKFGAAVQVLDAAQAAGIAVSLETMTSRTGS